MAHAYRAEKPPLITAEQLYDLKAQLEHQWYELDGGQLVLCEGGGFEQRQDAGMDALLARQVGAAGGEQFGLQRRQAGVFAAQPFDHRRLQIDHASLSALRAEAWV